MLGLYGFSGWFIGMQNSRFPMFIAITQNIVNIMASLIFVFVFGMKVQGVAMGTLIAQYGGFGMAVFLWFAFYRKRLNICVCWHEVMDKVAMRRFFQVNGDYFLSYALFGGGYYILYLYGCETGGYRFGC